MDAEKLLPEVKTTLRTTVDDEALDNEILGLIESALVDLEILGVVSQVFMDKQAHLIKTAVILYVKSLWGYDNPDAQRQMETYEQLKTQLSIHSAYDQVEDNDEI